MHINIKNIKCNIEFSLIHSLVGNCTYFAYGNSLVHAIECTLYLTKKKAQKKIAKRHTQKTKPNRTEGKHKHALGILKQAARHATSAAWTATRATQATRATTTRATATRATTKRTGSRSPERLMKCRKGC